MSSILSQKEFNKLRWLNVVMGVLHTGAAAIVLGFILGTNGITTNFYEIISDPIQSTGEIVFTLQKTGSLRLDWLVFAFFAVTAIAHFLYASNIGNFYYNALSNGGNPYRWIE